MFRDLRWYYVMTQYRMGIDFHIVKAICRGIFTCILQEQWRSNRHFTYMERYQLSIEVLYKIFKSQNSFRFGLIDQQMRKVTVLPG